MKDTEKNKQRKRVMRWLQRLESGRFAQGIGSLHVIAGTAESFCCLGVACHQMGNKLPKRMIPRNNIHLVEYDGVAGALPEFARTYFGFYGFLGECGDYSGSHDLFKLNDRGVSFKEIARTVRENLKQYFEWA